MGAAGLLKARRRLNAESGEEAMSRDVSEAMLILFVIVLTFVISTVWLKRRSRRKKP